MPEKKSVPITVAEHEDVTTPPTKRVLLYGWDGSAKTRLKTSAAGVLETSATISASPQPIRDGSNSSIWATVASYASANPLIVRLSDTTGAYVAAGAGTQYTSGASLATATGSVALGLDTANSVVKQVHVDSAGDLQVDVLTAPVTTVVATAASLNANVSATNLDIRDLVPADIVTVVATSSSFNAVVSATDLDIRDLAPTDIVTTVATASSFFVAPHTVYATAASFFSTVSGTATVTQTGAWAVQNVSPSSLYATVVASAASFNTTSAVYGTSSSLRVHPEASATGGYTNFTTASLTLTPILVNGAASTLGGYFLTNTNASYVYVKMWDKVSASSVSITSASYIAPTIILGLPANAGANVLDAVGAAFANGIVMNVNTEATTGSAPANQCVATVWYK